MTTKQLVEIISNLPDDTPIILSTEDAHEAKTVMIEYHSDGRMYVIISNLE
jgi:hypothetical protein